MSEHSLESLLSLSQENLAEILGFEFRPHLGKVSPPPDLIRGDFSRLIGSWGKQFRAIPIGKEDDSIVIATSDPLNISKLDALRECFGTSTKVVITTEEEIIRAINSMRTSLMSDRVSSLKEEEGEQSVDEINTSLKIDVTDAEDDDAPIIRYVNTLIFRAANERASDIHIEPYEEVLKVRFRIDGVLHDVDTEDKRFQASILSRVKVMANLNIAEKRLPQDGRIGLKIAGQDVDIRVSTVPTRYGERIVLRLLDKSKVMLNLPSLGMNPQIMEQMKRLIVRPHGIVLVTGPTGSGKTTTLYACLTEINTVDINILTIEDPVEYELGGVGQMQVNSKIDFTFANGLRSILRQDPDVIMVGEIRDLETVEIAIQASLTGHLVFSTLHTNDSAGAVTRLLDMGVEPFLISSSLLAIVAQRLVRRVCSSCKQPHNLRDTECRELGLLKSHINAPIFSVKEGGCQACQYSGFRGRLALHELLLIDDAIRSRIMQRADSNQIKSAAKNFISLKMDGASKVLQGVTTVEEVLRVSQEELLEW